MKTKNNYPTSEFEAKDRCPSCASYCNIFTDLNENDECNDCRENITQKQKIHKEIKNVIRKKGLTINKFEQDFGISKNTIHQIFKAKKINIEMVASINKALDIDNTKLNEYVKDLLK